MNFPKFPIYGKFNRKVKAHDVTIDQHQVKLIGIGVVISCIYCVYHLDRSSLSSVVCQILAYIQCNAKAMAQMC